MLPALCRRAVRTGGSRAGLSTMRAVRVHEHGDAGSLSSEEVPVPVPGPGEALVRNSVAGLNFIDTYHRSGLYKRPTPFVLGVEGAGVVESFGDGADSSIPVGGRVAYYSPGSYSEFSVVPAAQLLAVPEGVSLAQAAACMTQGLTAHYLVHSCPTVASLENEWVLAHAAGGGTGQLVVQMAAQRGARVIGTSSTAKLALGTAAGAEAMIDYTQVDDIAAAVKEITGGAGVRCVWDGVGADTWEKSLDCLAPRGLCVFFGNASGPVPPIDPLTLNAKGSLFITRPKLNDYIQTREELEWRALEVFSSVENGWLSVAIDKRFPLEGAADAHAYIESGATTGKVIIDVDSTLE